jgi:hypothetical protein
MERITTELISELKNELYERAATKTLIPLIKTPPIQKKAVKQPVVEKKPEIVKKTEPLPIEPPKETSISVAQIYKMIMDHGFYCDPNPGHLEVLLRLVVENGIRACIANLVNPCPFECKRTIRVPNRSGGITNTVSQHRTVKADIIPLYWAGDKIQKLTYREAIEKIKGLRQAKSGGYSDWRIPTIKELFSIVEHALHHNFFKLDLKTDIRGNYIPETMILWTSTPVEDKNKKEYIDICNSRTAYFIIKKEVKFGKHSLKFHLTCANDENKLYVLPVSSGVKTETKRFRRYEVQNKKLAPTSRPTKKEQAGGNIYIFDRIPPWTSDRPTSAGMKVAGAVKNWLTWRVEEKIKNENKKPLRNVRNHTIPIEIDQLDRMHDMIFKWESGFSDERRAMVIIDQYMIPNKVDVLVGVKYNVTYGDSRAIIFEIWPVVIFKSPQKLLIGKLELTPKDIEVSDGGRVNLDDDAQAKLFRMFNAALGGKKIKVEKKVTLAKKVKPGKKIIPPTTTKTPPIRLEPLYAAKLDFINASPYPVTGKKNQIEVRTITKAVRDEIAMQLRGIQKKWNKELVINKKGHKISNTLDNIGTLVEIINDEYKTPERKINQIINEQMTPNNIDIIIAGQYIFNPQNPNITIRAIVIIKPSSKMLVKNLLFRRRELIGTSNRVTIRLRKGAEKIIAEKVKDFLKGMYE